MELPDLYHPNELNLYRYDRLTHFNSHGETDTKVAKSRESPADSIRPKHHNTHGADCTPRHRALFSEVIDRGPRTIF
jgi:hypothetical protein